MAGPSIAVRVLGDMSGLGAAFGSAASTAATAGDKIKGAIGGALNTLNQTGILGPFGAAIQGGMDALDKLGQHGADVGAKMMGVGGIMAGVGVGLQAVASKEQASHQQLQQAVENTGASYDDYAGRVDSAIKSEEKFGDSADKTQDALRVLTQATHDPAQALDLLSTATDVAAAKHEDLTTAATAVGKVYNGNTKLLKEFGITMDGTTGKTKDGQTATEALAKVTGGQAAAAADTFTGKLNGIKASLEDSAASFATKYGPAITGAGVAVTGLGSAWEIATGIKTALTSATEAGTVADDAAAVSEGLALGPILLIIAAVAALGVGIYELVDHWSTVWATIKGVVMDVWSWISANWPLLLDILLGPIGYVVGWVIQNWHTVKDAIMDVWAWVRDNWPYLLGFLLGPIALAVAAIYKNWDSIKQGASDAVAWIKSTFDSVVGFFTGLGGRISSAVAGMWNGIFNAFRSVINEVINLWNQLHFTLPHIDLGPLGSIGGGTIGVPHIDPLASGGIVTRPTLALVGEAGPEAVIPLNKANKLGPAVHIQNATFTDQTDIDLLLRRAAWMTRTARV